MPAFDRRLLVRNMVKWGFDWVRWDPIVQSGIWTYRPEVWAHVWLSTCIIMQAVLVCLTSF